MPRQVNVKRSEVVPKSKVQQQEIDVMKQRLARAKEQATAASKSLEASKETKNYAEVNMNIAKKMLDNANKDVVLSQNQFDISQKEFHDAEKCLADAQASLQAESADVQNNVSSNLQQLTGDSNKKREAAVPAGADFKREDSIKKRKAAVTSSISGNDTSPVSQTATISKQTQDMYLAMLNAEKGILLSTTPLAPPPIEQGDKPALNDRTSSNNDEGDDEDGAVLSGVGECGGMGDDSDGDNSIITQPPSTDEEATTADQRDKDKDSTVKHCEEQTVSKPSSSSAAIQDGKSSSSTKEPVVSKSKENEKKTHQMFEVIVPGGVAPGQTFSLVAGGQRVTLICPQTAKSGGKVRFQLPIPKEGSDAKTRVTHPPSTETKHCEEPTLSKPGSSPVIHQDGKSSSPSKEAVESEQSTTAPPLESKEVPLPVPFYNESIDWMCTCGKVVPRTKKRCSCNKWRGGKRAPYETKKASMKKVVPAIPIKTDANTIDEGHWACTNCQNEVSNTKSRCGKCHRWRGGKRKGGWKIKITDVDESGIEWEKDWTCCDLIIPAAKKRCGKCNGWRGGKRVAAETKKQKHEVVVQE